MFSYIGIILATLEMHATSPKRLSYIANTIVHAKKTCAKYIAMVFSLVNSSATLKPISATKTSNLFFNIGADVSSEISQADASTVRAHFGCIFKATTECAT